MQTGNDDGNQFANRTVLLTNLLAQPVKSLDEFDYVFQTTISKREINSLLDFGFIETQENVVFIGSPGVGKTHLAIGLGFKAIEAGYKVCFTTALTLIEALELAELKGEHKKKINQLLKCGLRANA
jgi:DNA replication protein DnaC